MAQPATDRLLASTAGQMFQLFRSGEVHTRGELIAHTGLSRFTVTQRVDTLLDSGYLREEGEQASTGGRRPKRLVPNYEPRTILAADLGATHGRIAVLDGAGTALREATLESRIDSGPQAVLARVTSQWKKLLKRANRDQDSVCGIGLGVPGPVDVEAGRLFQPPIMPGWHNHPVRDQLAEHFGVPVFVENDANLMALGEASVTYPGSPSVLFVKVATGIGAGLVIDQSLYNGADGGAGDIGHVKVLEAAGHRCTCGAEGCLAAISSGAALARQLADRGHATRTSRDVATLVSAGNSDAVAATRTAGHVLGAVLATAVSILNPAALVLGGDMAVANEHLIGAVRETVYRRSQPLALRRLTLAPSELADRAGIAGAAALVRDGVFSAAEVDRALAARELR